MIQLAFETPGDNHVSRLIAGHDAPGRFSPVGLLFGADLMFEAHISFGVRFRQYVPDPTRFTFVPVPTAAELGTRASEDAVRQFCELQAGCGYDTCGVLAIGGMPFAKEDPSKWFCSEISCAALQTIGHFPGMTPHLLSPNGLYLMSQQPGGLI